MSTEEEELYPPGHYEKAFKRIFQELQKVNQRLASPLSLIAIDPVGRVRVIIDAGGTATPVSQSGTWNINNISGTISTFPVNQLWELIQRANIEFNECQRSKMTIT